MANTEWKAYFSNTTDDCHIERIDMELHRKSIIPFDNPKELRSYCDMNGIDIGIENCFSIYY